MTFVCNPANVAMLQERFAVEIRIGAVRIAPDPYCPAVDRPSWWRRWFLRQKPQPIFYRAGPVDFGRMLVERDLEPPR